MISRGLVNGHMAMTSAPLSHGHMVMMSSPPSHGQMAMMSAPGRLSHGHKAMISGPGPGPGPGPLGHRRKVTTSGAGPPKDRHTAAKAGGVPNSNYVVPLDKAAAASCITRPLAEILRDLNKRIPENILNRDSKQLIPWYHANRMLSFYAPGWCGEVRDVIFADDGSVTVVYRVTIRGSDGEAYRESTGTVMSSEADKVVDQVAAAEEIAFVRACARFGLGLYLYHEE